MSQGAAWPSLALLLWAGFGLLHGAIVLVPATTKVVPHHDPGEQEGVEQDLPDDPHAGRVAPEPGLCQPLLWSTSALGLPLPRGKPRQRLGVPRRGGKVCSVGLDAPERDFKNLFNNLRMRGLRNSSLYRSRSA